MMGVSYTFDRLYISKITFTMLIAIFSITMMIVIGCKYLQFKLINRQRREMASTEKILLENMPDFNWRPVDIVVHICDMPSTKHYIVLDRSHPDSSVYWCIGYVFHINSVL